MFFEPRLSLINKVELEKQQVDLALLKALKVGSEVEPNTLTYTTKQIMDELIEEIQAELDGMKTFFNLNTQEAKDFFNTNITSNYIRHMIARYNFIECLISQKSYEQIVFLSGRFLPLGRAVAHNNPNTNLFELVTPNCFALKNEVYQNSEIEQSSNFNLIPFDSKTDDITKVLKENGFEPSKSTLIMGESWTMYLTEADLVEQLNNLTTLLSERSHIFLSFGHPNTQRTATDQAALEKAKSPILFSLHYQNVIGFCNQNNFHVVEKLLLPDLHQIYGEDAKTQAEHLLNTEGAKIENFFLLKNEKGPQVEQDIEKINTLPVQTLELAPSTSHVQQFPPCIKS